MARKGYDIEGDNQTDVLVAALPTDGSTISYTQLWTKSHNRGIGSKDTFTRYLAKLVTAGRVLKDQDGYRLNLIYRQSYFRDHGGRPVHRDWSRMKGAEFSLSEQSDPEDAVKAHLTDLLEFAFFETIQDYVTMLTEISQAPNARAARDIYDLFEAHGTFSLQILARQVWTHRAKVKMSPNDLITLQITKEQRPPSAVRHVDAVCPACGETIGAFHQPLYDLRPRGS